MEQWALKRQVWEPRSMKYWTLYLHTLFTHRQLRVSSPLLTERETGAQWGETENGEGERKKREMRNKEAMLKFWGGGDGGDGGVGGVGSGDPVRGEQTWFLSVSETLAVW